MLSVHRGYGAATKGLANLVELAYVSEGFPTEVIPVYLLAGGNCSRQ
jgi:hypothetical protein